jgi:hypothetical protein
MRKNLPLYILVCKECDYVKLAASNIVFAQTMRPEDGLMDGFCLEKCSPSNTDTATRNCATAINMHTHTHTTVHYTVSGDVALIQLTEGSSSKYKYVVKVIRISTSTNTAKQKLAKGNNLHSAQQTEVYCEKLECMRVAMTIFSLQAPKRESLAADGPSVAASNRPRRPGIFHVSSTHSYLGHSTPLNKVANTDRSS